ncbi:MAG: PEP-CTERM sorting domain-containing protein [Isosphaeraceae bacterium]
MLAASASAGTIDASAVITETSSTGSTFDYSITLTNTGTGPSADSIATFWFAWVPNIDFLKTSPLSVTTPTGWSDIITHIGTTDGYGIQFEASSAATELAPGSSLVFQFQSADTPAELMGSSQAHPTHLVLQSFVYNMKEGLVGPFVGDSDDFDVKFASVPEPSTLTLAIVGLASLAALRLRRKSAA